MSSRYHVERVEVGDGLHGPDHPWKYEHRVVETATGRVVLTFEERPDLSRPWDPSYEGVSSVRIDDDANVVVSYHGGGSERIPLP